MGAGKEENSVSQTKSSSEKLLTAVINLVAEKGYHGVSTKEIAAAAGVNEVTLFRHFGSKQNLLESAFHYFHYAEEMKKLFSEKLVGELYDDLLLISRTYHSIMYRNRKCFRSRSRKAAFSPSFARKRISILSS